MAEKKGRGTGRRVAKKKKRTEKTRLPFHVRREIWGVLCLFLAFVACLAIFEVDGFLVEWYEWLVRTLVGFGSNIMVLTFTCSALVLFIKRRGRARLKVCCLNLLPVVAGAIFHITRNAEGWKALGASGRALLSGGYISGTLGNLLRLALSRVGALIFLYILLAAGIVIASGEFVLKFIGFIRKMHMEPEPEEEEEQIPVPSRRKPSRPVDVFTEDDDFVKPQVPPAAVRTPAQAVQSIFAGEQKPAARPDPAAPAKPTFGTSEAELPRPAEIKPREVPKDTQEDAAQDSSVEEQIENNLGTDIPKYMYPPISLLKEGMGRPAGSKEAIEQCSRRLIGTLSNFGVEATLVDVTSGPTVTRFEVQLQAGIRVSRVESLSVDIALALGASGVRISTIPDKNAIGIEIPNEVSEIVTARDLIGTNKFRDSQSRLSFAVGKDIGGDAVIGDIARMPHMLIAGTTGSGKSVCINTILISLLYKSTPDEVRLIMVDPKMIELKVYNGIPHLLIPVVTDPKKAAGALNWAVGEMMKRYKLFSEVGARDLKSYNAEMKKREDGDVLPQIVIVIDELSDLMVAARNEVEEAIIRIAQMARAAGMHLIIATQRPSADVITGLMKANIPSRIAFAVSSQLESRIILDQMGAEKLIGRGDMLYSPLGGGKPRRIQGCFVSDEEVESVVDFVKQKSGDAHYSDELINHLENQDKAGAAESGVPGGDADDEMFEAAVDVIIEGGQASTSMLQRRLKLGYARAARIMDVMEERGIVGGFEGSKPRQILITRDEWNEMKLRTKS